MELDTHHAVEVLPEELGEGEEEEEVCVFVSLHERCCG